MMSNTLEMKKICKDFSGVEVLRNVDFSVDQGEIRALLGANGAGKSTLMKILSGVYHATSGEIFINGEKTDINTPEQAATNGVGIVHQELSIIPTLTMLQNFFLGHEIKKHCLINERKMRKEYEKACKEFGFRVEPDVKASQLSVANQQMVEIMKNVHADANIIIFDEPTTSLTDEEKEMFFEVILKLKDQGKTIIYISHILEEIFRLSDTVSIMRNGEMVGTFPTSELSVPIISEHMSGHKVDTGTHTCHSNLQSPPKIKVSNLNGRNGTRNVSFTIQPGEVIGLAGLVGAGRTEIVKTIFGADKITSGEILVEGKKIKITDPKSAIDAGIGLVPEDRKREGVILKHEIYKNSTLIQLGKMLSGGLLSTTKEKKYAQEAVESLSIKIPGLSSPVEKLSGGNQQKVVVSKWLNDEMKLLIFDEPTKGIDIAAKEDIFQTIEKFAEKGMAIIFISSDLNEVLRVSDRIFVVKNKTIIKEMINNGVTQKDIMDEILQQGNDV